jgi:hypothetical protein
MIIDFLIVKLLLYHLFQAMMCPLTKRADMAPDFEHELGSQAL